MDSQSKLRRNSGIYRDLFLMHHLLQRRVIPGTLTGQGPYQSRVTDSLASILRLGNLATTVKWSIKKTGART